jgi:hypothetical protein
MTKAEIVNEIVERTGLERNEVQTTVESFLKSLRILLQMVRTYISGGLVVSLFKSEKLKWQEIFRKTRKSPFQNTLFRNSNLPKRS